MNPIFKKLNFKEQKIIFAINAPSSFEKELESMKEFAKVSTKVKSKDEVEFAICFATKQTEVDTIAKTIAPQLKGDAIFWVCYPKGTSKKYKCDFNRDTGWNIMGKYNLEGVRMVAIDEDWSALRFRKVDYIKTLTRKFSAISPKGKKKANQK